jgi:type IV pilus assembly protein PilX
MMRIYRTPRKQQGAVLITSIVLMIVFTLLGVAAMRTNITDISIQGSIKNRSNALQCAEAALRAGEIWLDDLSNAAYAVTSTPSQGANQVWDVNLPDLQNPELKDDSFWRDDTKTWAYGGALQDNTRPTVGCQNDARYFIESLGAISADSEGLDFSAQAKGRSAMYRITAYSTGIDGNAAVVLQSTYLQPIN